MADSLSVRFTGWTPPPPPLSSSAAAHPASASAASAAAGTLAPDCKSRSNPAVIEKWLIPVPIHIVTQASQLPLAFLEPDENKPLIIGFDCEGVNLARHGRLCIMQLAFEDAVYLVDAVEGGNTLMHACKPGLESPYVTKVVHDCKRDSEALFFQYGIKLHNVFDTQIAYTLIEEQQGKKTWTSDDSISFVGLLKDERYCGVVYDEKEEVRSLMKKDPQFWTRRPWTEMMTRVAADDVRFLLCIYEKMMKRLDSLSLWQLNVRGCLYCRCFCDVGDNFTSWPSPPLSDHLTSEDKISGREEILAVVNVIPGYMGRIIGKKGASILSIKQSCRAVIFTGGMKGPPDKVFVIGPIKEVKKAEAILRGRML